MQRYRAEIEVPEGACWQTIEDAKLRATWQKVVTLDDRMRKTNLDGKCGSCKYFKPKTFLISKTKCYGDCLKGRAGNRQRSCKACKRYERKDDD